MKLNVTSRLYRTSMLLSVYDATTSAIVCSCGLGVLPALGGAIMGCTSIDYWALQILGKAKTCTIFLCIRQVNGIEKFKEACCEAPSLTNCRPWRVLPESEGEVNSKNWRHTSKIYAPAGKIKDAFKMACTVWWGYYITKKSTTKMGPSRKMTLYEKYVYYEKH